MELLSSVTFDDVKRVSCIGRRTSLCTISKKNLVAFSAPRCYKPARSRASTGRPILDDNKNSLVNCDFGGVADTVFVCALASPWNVYVVTHIESEIKHILWDASGTKLLLADASGQILLWQMHESLINYWTLSSMSKSLNGDDVIALKWVNSSQLFTIAKDVREQTTYEKKFPLAGVLPSIGFFGGRSIDYWVAVTSSGVVGVGVVQQKSEMVVSKTPLEYFENGRIIHADIVIESNGSIQVVTSTGKIRDPIRLHKLTTDISSHGYFIQSSNLCVSSSCFSCFFADKCAEADSITSVKYGQPLSGQTVLVSINKSGYSEIQHWTMHEETLGLHTAFHANPIIPERNFYWIRQTSLRLRSLVTASTSFPLITDNTSLFPFGALFACDDGSIKQTVRQSLGDGDSRSFSVPADVHVSSISLSTNGCVCVAVSNKCDLYIFSESSITTEHTTALLEHSLATGTSWEDVLMCLRSESGLHDKVWTAVESNLSHQSAGIQAQLKNKLFMLRIGLSMSNDANGSFAVDYLTALLLRHIRNSFFSVLSSSQYDELDHSAEQKFVDAVKLDGPLESDVDKIVSDLQPSGDYCPEDAIVYPLQPMVQWVCDLSITLLSSLPEYTASNKSGSWLVKDMNSIAVLREALLLVRLWYNCMPKLRPTLSCGVSFDVVAKLFKMLSLLLNSLKMGDVLSDALLDECSLLPSQVVLPPFDKSLGWNYLPASINSRTFTAVKYVFGEEPDFTRCLRLPFRQYISNARKDVFSQIEVNSHSNKDGFKRCIRCHATTALIKPITEQINRMSAGPAITHYCICGGLWYLETKS